MWIVPEQQVADLVTPELCFEQVSAAFASMDSGRAMNLPVVRESLGYQDAIYGFKSGFDAEHKILGVKGGGYWPNNAAKGLTNHQSAVVLFDADTGRVKAMMGGNRLTALRTAAASSISISLLARKDAEVIGIVGAGLQSAFQLDAALMQRSFKSVLVWNIEFDEARLEPLRKVAQKYNVDIKYASLEDLTRASDVIITVTSASEILVRAEWVQPGTHIACMGADTRGKQETDPQIAALARCFTDELEQSTSIGEFQHAVGMGVIGAEDICMIGGVVRGVVEGRQTAEQITVFDSTGVALQDLLCAEAVLEQAIDQKIAQWVDFYPGS